MEHVLSEKTLPRERFAAYGTFVSFGLMSSESMCRKIPLFCKTGPALLALVGLLGVVNAFVLPEIAFLGESLATMLALVRFLAGMDKLVIPKLISPSKPLIAHVALERLFAGLAGVNAQMLPEICFLRKSLPTQIALVMFHTSMDELVSAELIFPRKSLVAHFAAEWSFAGVSALVSLEWSFLAESCATRLALVGLLACVNAVMYLEGATLCESLAAMLAWKRFLTSMDALMNPQMDLPRKPLIAYFAQERLAGVSEVVNLE